jgi:hypothetical protein
MLNICCPWQCSTCGAGWLLLAVTSSIISAVTALTSSDNCQDLHTWAWLVKHVLLLLLLPLLSLLLLLLCHCTANAAVAAYHTSPFLSSLLFVVTAGSHLLCMCRCCLCSGNIRSFQACNVLVCLCQLLLELLMLLLQLHQQLLLSRVCLLPLRLYMAEQNMPYTANACQACAVPWPSQ